MHLVVRLFDRPLRVFATPGDYFGRIIATAVVGGPRSCYYIREIGGRAGAAVGALLLPGAAERLFGVPATALAERHTPLAALWGDAATDRLIDQLAEVRDPAQRIAVFEAELLRRLDGAANPHPAVQLALAQFAAGVPVREVVRVSGFSHRHFSALFQATVGLKPKLYCRVQRFVQTLACSRLHASWAEVAGVAGYADQAHLSRDFAEFSGLSPGGYRRIAPGDAHHVPLPADTDVRNGQFPSRTAPPGWRTLRGPAE